VLESELEIFLTAAHVAKEILGKNKWTDQIMLNQLILMEALLKN
jgi:hypothetical protein